MKVLHSLQDRGLLVVKCGSGDERDYNGRDVGRDLELQQFTNGIVTQRPRIIALTIEGRPWPMRIMSKASLATSVSSCSRNSHGADIRYLRAGPPSHYQ